MTEGRTHKFNIPEDDHVSAEAFGMILQYLYGGKLEPKTRQLIPLLKTANYFIMTFLIEALSKAISSKIKHILAFRFT